VSAVQLGPCNIGYSVETTIPTAHISVESDLFSRLNLTVISKKSTETYDFCRISTSTNIDDTCMAPYLIARDRPIRVVKQTPTMFVCKAILDNEIVMTY